MHVDDVLEAEFAREPIWAAERLAGEPRQMIDVGRHALDEHRLEQRIGEHLVVEQLLEPMQTLITAGMLIETFH